MTVSELPGKRTQRLPESWTDHRLFVKLSSSGVLELSRSARPIIGHNVVPGIGEGRSSKSYR